MFAKMQFIKQYMQHFEQLGCKTQAILVLLLKLTLHKENLILFTEYIGLF